MLEFTGRNAAHYLTTKLQVLKSNRIAESNHSGSLPTRLTSPARYNRSAWKVPKAVVSGKIFSELGNIPRLAEFHILLEQNHKPKRNWSVNHERRDFPICCGVRDQLSGASHSSTEEDVQRHWQGVVKRRSFLKGLGIASATLSAGALFATKSNAEATQSKGKLSKGDAALLRFAAAVELIEADLWQQYNELGGVQGGNPAYIAALSNLDGDMPQYVADNTDDELSHAAFLNAYLISKGEEPVDLDAFRTLASSQATGAKDIGRLTNLLKLNVDLSWYTRYRSTKNPDFGVNFKGPFTIANQPAIPLNDNDTPSTQTQPVPPATPQEARMQAIANTAGFHFAFIEQGGASLYPTLAFKATDPEVLRILVSIGGVEIDHFGLWHDKAGNAVAQPLAGVTDPETGLTFPDLNALNSSSTRRT